MNDRHEPAQALRFGRFDLQPHERRLLADGQPVVLGARAFDLLLVLVNRSGQLVTKGELLESVWPGLVVDEANLSVQVSTLRKVLGGDLIATIPGRGYRFTGRVEAVSANGPAVAGLAAATPAVVDRPSATTGLPWLIGRDDERAALSDDVSAPGCVTLVGPAGVGKTTLARAVSAAVPGGSVWVDLAPLTAGEQVAAAAARTLGLSTTAADQLAAAAAGRLWVMDNAEHVIDAVADLVSQLLRAEASTRVLTTSQRRLAVAGERVHRLAPLAVAAQGDPSAQHQGAIELFVDRAKAADHRFEVTPAQWPLVAEICRQLDGLPLALEMAAARVPVLGLSVLAQALQRRFSVLTGGRRDAAARHRSLQAALDWSHDLLAPAEQRLYRLCGVFTGGFTLDLLVDVAAAGADTAGDVDGARWAIIESLTQLVDRSLVAVGDGDPPRYRLLETQREDASRRLATADETVSARQQLLAALALRARRVLAPGPAAVEHAALLRAEHDNLREAIAWGRQQPDAAIRADAVAVACATAIAASHTVWRLQAAQWLDSCEALAEAPGLAPWLRARWWIERAIQWVGGQRHDARPVCERALATARELGDDRLEAMALAALVCAAGVGDDELQAACEALRALAARHPEWEADAVLMLTLANAEAMAMHRLRDQEGLLRSRLRQLELARRFGRVEAALATETNLVFALQALGRFPEALERSRELIGRLGGNETGNAAYAWIGLLVSLQTLGRFDEFRAALPGAARVLRLHGLPMLAPLCALVLAAEDRPVDALRVLGHARVLLAARGMTMTDEEQSALDAFERQARTERGDAAVDLCLSEGGGLDEAAVDALMLGAAGTAPAARPQGAAEVLEGFRPA